MHRIGWTIEPFGGCRLTSLAVDIARFPAKNAFSYTEVSQRAEATGRWAEYLGGRRFSSSELEKNLVYMAVAAFYGGLALFRSWLAVWFSARSRSGTASPRAGSE